MELCPTFGKTCNHCHKPNHRRAQEVGETDDHYRTALRKLADECEFGTITPDETLCDRFVFGVRDAKVRKDSYVRLI